MEMTMETEMIDKLFLELAQVTTAITPKEVVMMDALQKLAKLGNEPLYGNSVGNSIALDALKNIGDLSSPELKMSEWQPIETAPDEYTIDVWIGSTMNPEFGVRITSVHRIGTKWFGIPDHYNTDKVKPTHWMPYPGRPK